MTGRMRAVATDAKCRKAPTIMRERKESRAKEYVLECIANLANEGLAQLDHTADGVSKLRLITGEIYLLGETTLRRIA
jgi:hypothetical protein